MPQFKAIDISPFPLQGFPTPRFQAFKIALAFLPLPSDGLLLSSFLLAIFEVGNPKHFHAIRRAVVPRDFDS